MKLKIDKDGEFFVVPDYLKERDLKNNDAVVRCAAVGRWHDYTLLETNEHRILSVDFIRAWNGKFIISAFLSGDEWVQCGSHCNEDHFEKSIKVKL